MQGAEHNEKTAQKEYEQMMVDAKETRAQDMKTIGTAESSKADSEGQLAEAKTGHQMTSEEMSQNLAYKADLHQSCDFIKQNFDMRKEARTAEIASLTNA